MDIWFIIAYDSIIQKARMTTRISKTSIFKCKNKNNNKRNHSSNIRQHWWKMHTYHNKLAHEQIQICMHQIISQLTKDYWKKISKESYIDKLFVKSACLIIFLKRRYYLLGFFLQFVMCWLTFNKEKTMTMIILSWSFIHFLHVKPKSFILVLRHKQVHICLKNCYVTFKKWISKRNRKKCSSLISLI